MLPECVPTILLTPEQIDAILDCLFTNGAGQRASRLVLVDEDNKDLGGWCREAVRSAITQSPVPAPP